MGRARAAGAFRCFKRQNRGAPAADPTEHAAAKKKKQTGWRLGPVLKAKSRYKYAFLEQAGRKEIRGAALVDDWGVVLMWF